MQSEKAAHDRRAQHALPQEQGLHVVAVCLREVQRQPREHQDARGTVGTGGATMRIRLTIDIRRDHYAEEPEIIESRGNVEFCREDDDA